MLNVLAGLAAASNAHILLIRPGRCSFKSDRDEQQSPLVHFHLPDQAGSIKGELISTIGGLADQILSCVQWKFGSWPGYDLLSQHQPVNRVVDFVSFAKIVRLERHRGANVLRAHQAPQLAWRFGTHVPM